MSSLQEIRSVRVSRKVALNTRSHLRYMGKRGFEGFVLWVGTRDGPVFTVAEAIAPRQRAVRSDHGTYVTVDSDELHRLNVLLYKSKLVLLAQVHSHPGEAYHSETDDRFPIATTTGSYSMVVPDFAVREFSLAECAVYRLEASGDWNAVPPAAVEKIFSIVD